MDLHAPGSSSASIHDQLLADRKNLLDLGTRNRLINIPLRAKSIRAVEIVDEISVEVYSMLTEGKGMTFLPGRSLTPEEKAELEQEDDLVGAIPQPDDADVDDRGLARRHSDNRLQTRLTSEGLQKRLLDIWYDSRTLEEEQGVNVLYLAIGLLKWFEDDKSDVERHAPLILLPVRLERTTAAERFTLRSRGETPSTNLSLQAKLNGEFGIKLPDIPEEDEIDIAQYIAAVAAAVSGKTRWKVLPDAMVLGFFSFAKFLMYRDLDPENWPAHGKLDEHPVIRGLLRDGFPHREPIVSDTGRIDELIPPEKIAHVVEADSSQSVVVEEIGQGHHLVVKGPPGTGKSQTITNIIAAAAEQGKKVLFVAEKMAALDVVHRRLRDVGLGGLTLELHSNKANKRAVLEELKKTRDLVPRATSGDTTVISRLREAQDVLNGHTDVMHERRAPSAMSPYLRRPHRESSRGPQEMITDTCVFSLYNLPNPHPAIQSFIESGGARLGLVAPVEAELYGGFAAKRAVSWKRAFEIMERMTSATRRATWLDMSPRACRFLGAMTHHPKLQAHYSTHPSARRVKMPGDLMIAACSIAHAMPVATVNVRHFLEIDEWFRLPGIYNPLSGEWARPPYREIGYDFSWLEEDVPFADGWWEPVDSDADPDILAVAFEPSL